MNPCFPCLRKPTPPPSETPDPCIPLGSEAALRSVGVQTTAAATSDDGSLKEYEELMQLHRTESGCSSERMLIRDELNLLNVSVATIGIRVEATLG